MGSTVPTKFRVCNASGASIGTPGIVIGYGLVAAANSPTITVDEDIYSTTPDTAFRWDSSGQQWIFNQSTKNNPSLNKTGVPTPLRSISTTGHPFIFSTALSNEHTRAKVRGRRIVYTSTAASQQGGI